MALLSAAEDADAASLMAAADATGRTTREKLISANPFLKALTVAEIKSWADRKMAWAIRQSACESLKKPRDGEKEDSSIGA
ncbi:hypothetical protein [Bradyrhizobium sp. McL0616]|uniref:hypothetical protein n=1 Tax=Bradyrhizobium sp. McL0616 TaxID=3415674 RepID=UPI003CF80325